MTKIFHFIDDIASMIHKGGTLVLMPFMGLIVFVDVLLRYLFNSPLLWAHEANGLLLFTVLVFSLVNCWNRDRHVRMEVFYSKFPYRLKSLSNVITGITGIFIFSLLAIQSIKDVPYMIKTHEAGEELLLPLWPFKVLLALISVLFIFTLIKYIIMSVKKDKEEEL